MASQHIVAVGAGVLGLSAAVTIQKRHPSVPICIIAQEFPYPPPYTSAEVKSTDSSEPLKPRKSQTNEESTQTKPSADYASMWAGAHYRPIPGRTPQLLREQQWAFRTTSKMLEIASTTPEAGVEKMPGLLYLEDPPTEYTDLNGGDKYAFGHIDDGFRVLHSNELPKDVLWGCQYDKYCLNPHIYCSWLLNQFLRNGGRCVQRKLDSLDDAFTVAADTLGAAKRPIMVNCSGRNLDHDPAIQINRGQTVLVRNEYHSTPARVMKDGTWCFLIPRPCGGGTIVGGTRESGDWEDQPRSETRRKLLENAVEYFPDFVDSVDKFDVVQDNVGRRPLRDGGVRLEIENPTRGPHIVHGYGVGGRGLELSWGVAEEIADIVDSLLVDGSKL